VVLVAEVFARAVSAEGLEVVFAVRVSAASSLVLAASGFRPAFGLRFGFGPRFAFRNRVFFPQRRFAFAAVPLGVALGYGASCWSWQPTAWGWQRVWACGYGDGYGGWGRGGWGY
jgi:hypothetical protein